MLSAECSDSRESVLAIPYSRDVAAELAADNDSIVFARNGKLVTTLLNINPALAPRAVYKPLRPEDVNVEVTSGADGMRSTLDAADREFDRTAYVRM